jgi:L,D-transpeptidase catalytic domain
MPSSSPRVRGALSPRFRLALMSLVTIPTLAISVRPATTVASAHERLTAASAPARFSAADWEGSAIGAIDPHVFDLALGAASCAVRSGDVSDPATLTVIDYSKPSTTRRLWVFDLRAHRLLYHELVAHGQGSGESVPTRFSNESDTHQSSLGLFETEDVYVGKNGYSLRLDGLDAGFNDHARERGIVIHGASYVSDEVARSNGRLGRSWGCPALRQGIAREVIDRVKGGSLVFAYFPDAKWLSASKYLGRGCG